jgi:hypothetical protein
LVVLQEDDYVMSVHVEGDVTVYVFASAGVAEVPYPHTALAAGTAYPAGTVVAGRFDIITANTPNSYGMFELVGRMEVPVSLDGILETKGLSFIPGQPIPADYTEVGPGGKPHARLLFLGEHDTIGKFWMQQKQHELLHGVYLSDQIQISPATPTRNIDFGELLEIYCGSRAAVFLHDELPADMQAKLVEFVYESHPAGSVLLLATIPTTL